MIGSLRIGVRAALAVAAVGLLLAGGGCEYYAEMAADSASQNPGRFEPGPQFVHVGEKLKLLFVARHRVGFDEPTSAPDDYILLQTPAGYAIRHADPNDARYIIPTVIATTGPKRITATAYRIRHRRDHEVDRGELMTWSDPNEPRDEKLASASIHLNVYQSRVIFEDVGGPGIEPDWRVTAIKVIADGGKRVSEVHKLVPGEEGSHGFTVEGPDGQGRYTIIYEPSAEQVNRGGETLAELHLRDKAAGKTKVYSKRFETP